MNLKTILKRIRLKLLLLQLKSLGKESVKVKLKSGQLLSIRLCDPLGRQILKDEAFEAATRDRILNEVTDGMTVLDVGANIGYYTVQFAQRVGPGGGVIAFEPNPVMIAELDANLKLNRLENVRILPFALCDKNAEAEFYCPQVGREAHGSLAPNETFVVNGVIRVQTRKLDDVLSELGTDAVDFIKIDAEGAERDIFRGAKRTLSAAGRPTIFFECAEAACRPFGHSVGDVVRELADCGYVIERMEDSNWLAKPTDNPLLSS